MNKKNLPIKKVVLILRLLIILLISFLQFHQKKKGKKKFSNIGGFGSISDIPNHIKQPKIVACTDGVGTKV